jgi:hypothetical protein
MARAMLLLLLLLGLATAPCQAQDLLWRREGIGG